MQMHPLTQVYLQSLPVSELQAWANRLADDAREGFPGADELFMEALSEMSRREQAAEATFLC